jgi:2-keto-4-pentenoate hydratase/2-oxohepta-3-ene-1,7-dioic acid hydratase in catechol pathway
MKFLSYRIGEYETWGALDVDQVIDLGVRGQGIAPSLKEAITQGVVPDRLALGGVRHGIAGIEFLPVIPDPGKILCVGVNYRTHADEAGTNLNPYPTIFTRFADTQIGHGQAALRPTDSFDYEGELAVVIGRAAYRVAESDAMTYVAGYSCYNDFSVRDWQNHSTQWTPGKNFPGTGAFGPYFVPRDDIVSLPDLKLMTRVNGEVRQSAPLSHLVFDIPQLIAYASSFTQLAPGDVIVSGTPGGVGKFMVPPTYLQEGDQVEVEVSGIGTLRNPVASAG